MRACRHTLGNGPGGVCPPVPTVVPDTGTVPHHGLVAWAVNRVGGDRKRT
jgi:hypothetical protein